MCLILVGDGVGFVGFPIDMGSRHLCSHSIAVDARWNGGVKRW